MIETPDLLPIREWVEAFRLINGTEMYGAICDKSLMSSALSSSKYISEQDFLRLKKLLLTGVKDDGKIMSDQSFDQLDANGRYGFFELLADIIHKNFSKLQCLQQQQQKNQS